MRKRLLPKILLAGVVGLAFVFPQTASAEFSTPYKLNLNAGNLPREVCLANSGGQDEICAAGAVVGAIEELSAITDSSGVCSNYTCYANLINNVGRGVATSQSGSSNGLGTLLMKANFGLIEQRPSSGVVFAMEQVGKVFSPDTVSAEPLPYAPKTGYDLLRPLQDFWAWSVTISYSFMILIILVVAFALMFRARLDGSQVVQLQNAIPNIVLAMILIPLSYPISGLFIDTIALGTNAVHGILFSPSGPARNVYETGIGQQGTQFDGDNTRGLYADDWRLNVFRVREALDARPLGEAAGIVVCPSVGEDENICKSENYGVLTVVDSILTWIFGRNAEPGADGISLLVGNIVNLLFNLVAIIVSIRVAWRLIKKLLTLLFLPILAPFIFATVAIPGTGTKNLITYLKQMGSASLHYIVSYTIFLFAIIFMNQAFYNTVPDIKTYNYSPPLLGRIGEVVSGGANQATDGDTSAIIFVLLGAGLFLATPKLLDTIDERLNLEGGFLPKALQPFVDDIRYSGDVALRKAPATIRGVGATTAGTLYSNTVGVVGSRIGAYKSDPFGESTGERTVREMRADLADLQRKIDSTSNPITKNVLRGRMALTRGLMNAGAQTLGQGAALTPPKGEKGVSFKIDYSFPELEGGYATTRLIKDIINRGGSIGIVTLGVSEDATPPMGPIVFKNFGKHPLGYTIAELPLDSNPALKARVVLTNAADPSGGSVTVTQPTKAFYGDKSVFVNVTLVFDSDNAGVWSAVGPNRIHATVGESAVVRSGNIQIAVRSL